VSPIPATKQVTIYTDGACSGNPGPGGWAAVMIYGELRKEISGYEAHTTNNRMELLSAIRGLEALKTRCMVTIYSDSSYLVNAFLQGWLASWRRNGWKTTNKTPVENQELWQRLLELCDLHEISWVKVKGHAQSTENNRCDQLARGEIARAREAGQGLEDIAGVDNILQFRER